MPPQSIDSPVRFGPFVLLKQLGVGGMGAAYLAKHVDSGSLLVVKRMHPEFLKDEGIFKRFVHEAQVAVHVRHPNVASLVAMGTIDREPFLATEFVFGIQLSHIVDRIENSQIEPVPLGIGLALAVDLANGVVAIHGARHRETGQQLDLIHRDISSRNVLVGFDGRLRIIDLGLGKSVLADWLTASQVLAGSPDYMPPEQAMGARVDARADVYATAVTIWELLVGRKRIREDGVAARLARAIQAQPEPLLSYRADASKRLESILKQAMHPDPQQRTPTAQILTKVLEEELRELGRPPPRQDIVAWLDSACATVIAREKRLLAEVRALASSDTRPTAARTEMLVGSPEGFSARSPYDFYEDFDRSKDAGETEPGGMERGSPRRWERSSMLGALGAVLLAVVGILVVVLVQTSSEVEVIVLPRAADEASGAFGGAPRAVGLREDGSGLGKSPSPERGMLLDGDPSRSSLTEPDAAAAGEVAPAKSGGGGSPARTLSPEVASRKAELVRRIRQLRRVRFDVGFQRRLTEASARLSRARTSQALDDVEGAIFRMESEKRSAAP